MSITFRWKALNCFYRLNMTHLLWKRTVLFLFVFNWIGVDWLRKNARSIQNANSARSSANYWNDTRQAIPRFFSYTIATNHFAMQETGIGIQLACIWQVSLG